MAKQDKKLTQEQAEARIDLLTDRLAILLVVVKSRYGGDWAPWFGEEMWHGIDGMGEEIREWSDYKMALDIVKLFMERSERG